MVGPLVASWFAITCFVGGEPAPEAEGADEVRAAYAQFVERVNTLANSVTADAWSQDLIARLHAIDPARVSQAGVPTISVDRADLAFADARFGLLIARRTARWPKKDGAPGETTHDSVLAVLSLAAGPTCRVACQFALSEGEQIRRDSSMTSPSALQAQATLESILEAITAGDRDVVRQSVSAGDGRSLSGEVGWFLDDPGKKKEVRWDELTAVACSDRTFILVARIISLELNADPKERVAGWSTLSQPLLVFRRADDKSWKLEAELFGKE